MKWQRFYIGERDWEVTALYDVRTEDDFDVMESALARAGCRLRDRDEAVMVLHGWNKGFTFTNYDGHCSVMVTGKATSGAEQFNSIVHELKHLVEHVSSYYGVDPKQELAAYLQGEVGRQMFPVVVEVLCCQSGGTALHGEWGTKRANRFAQ